MRAASAGWFWLTARVSKRLVATLLALFTTAGTPAKTYVGIQGLFIVGAHRDVAGSQYGVGGGPLLQVHASARRLALTVEGIPVVSIPNIRPSAAYGQATPALGILNWQVEAAADRSARLWLGLGETVYNQRTPLPAIDQVASSRLAGVRYTARYTHDTRNNHFVEALFATAPKLSGSDHFAYSDGNPPVDKPERASEIDASLALGYHAHDTVWLFGLRTLNFSAQFTATGEAADRNVGIGPMIEWRRLLP